MPRRIGLSQKMQQHIHSLTERACDLQNCNGESVLNTMRFVEFEHKAPGKVAKYAMKHKDEIQEAISDPAKDAASVVSQTLGVAGNLDASAAIEAAELFINVQSALNLALPVAMPALLSNPVTGIPAIGATAAYYGTKGAVKLGKMAYNKYDRKKLEAKFAMTLRTGCGADEFDQGAVAKCMYSILKDIPPEDTVMRSVVKQELKEMLPSYVQVRDDQIALKLGAVSQISGQYGNDEASVSLSTEDWGEISLSIQGDSSYQDLQQQAQYVYDQISNMNSDVGQLKLANEQMQQDVDTIKHYIAHQEQLRQQQHQWQQYHLAASRLYELGAVTGNEHLTKLGFVAGMGMEALSLGNELQVAMVQGSIIGLTSGGAGLAIVGVKLAMMMIGQEEADVSFELLNSISQALDEQHTEVVTMLDTLSENQLEIFEKICEVYGLMKVHQVEVLSYLDYRLNAIETSLVALGAENRDFLQRLVKTELLNLLDDIENNEASDPFYRDSKEYFGNNKVLFRWMRNSVENWPYLNGEVQARHLGVLSTGEDQSTLKKSILDYLRRTSAEESLGYYSQVVQQLLEESDDGTCQGLDWSGIVNLPLWGRIVLNQRQFRLAKLSHNYYTVDGSSLNVNQFEKARLAGKQVKHFIETVSAQQQTLFKALLARYQNHVSHLHQQAQLAFDRYSGEMTQTMAVQGDQPQLLGLDVTHSFSQWLADVEWQHLLPRNRGEEAQAYLSQVLFDAVDENGGWTLGRIIVKLLLSLLGLPVCFACTVLYIRDGLKMSDQGVGLLVFHTVFLSGYALLLRFIYSYKSTNPQGAKTLLDVDMISLGSFNNTLLWQLEPLFSSRSSVKFEALNMLYLHEHLSKGQLRYNNTISLGAAPENVPSTTQLNFTLTVSYLEQALIVFHRIFDFSETPIRFERNSETGKVEFMLQHKTCTLGWWCKTQEETVNAHDFMQHHWQVNYKDLSNYRLLGDGIALNQTLYNQVRQEVSQLLFNAKAEATSVFHQDLSKQPLSTHLVDLDIDVQLFNDFLQLLNINPEHVDVKLMDGQQFSDVVHDVVSRYQSLDVATSAEVKDLLAEELEQRMGDQFEQQQASFLQSLQYYATRLHANPIYQRVEHLQDVLLETESRVRQYLNVSSLPDLDEDSCTEHDPYCENPLPHNGATRHAGLGLLPLGLVRQATLWWNKGFTVTTATEESPCFDPNRGSNILVSQGNEPGDALIPQCQTAPVQLLDAPKSHQAHFSFSSGCPSLFSGFVSGAMKEAGVQGGVAENTRYKLLTELCAVATLLLVSKQRDPSQIALLLLTRALFATESLPKQTQSKAQLLMLGAMLCMGGVAAMPMMLMTMAYFSMLNRVGHTLGQQTVRFIGPVAMSAGRFFQAAAKQDKQGFRSSMGSDTFVQ